MFFNNLKLSWFLWHLLPGITQVIAFVNKNIFFPYNLEREILMTA